MPQALPWGKRLIYFDGGLGTMLQGMGLTGGASPATWNLLRPECVLEVHKRYLDAGCDVISTNTFDAATALSEPDGEKRLRAGVRIARRAVAEAGHGVVALSLGSLGRLLRPYGDVPFEEAVAAFREAGRIGLSEGVDALLLETMTDMLEIKAAVVGLREALDGLGPERERPPLWVSATFDLNGRLLTGANIEGLVAMLAGLHADAVGLNCGDAPDALLPNVQALLACCPLPVFVSPNASKPVVRDGRTCFPTDPERFARSMLDIARLGAWGIGGCCGTTPEHIARMIALTRDVQPAARTVPERCVISGRASSLALGERPVLIGERLNPTGKKRMKQALREGDMAHLLQETVAQLDAGADALDVNVGMPELDERSLLPQVVREVQTVCDAPLQLDTADPTALEAALRRYCGKPLINSVCGKQAVMDSVFPLARRYGGAVVALTLDEEGIPPTAEGRLRIARRIIDEAARYDIGKNELLFDALTLSVSAEPEAARVTLETLRRLRDELGVKTVLGVSNVSFGLPRRPLLTATFLSMALQSGLSAAILNPLDPAARDAFDAASALLGYDEGFRRYISQQADRPEPTREAVVRKAAGMPDAPDAHDPERALQKQIEKGLAAEAGRGMRALLDGGAEPLSMIERCVMPALAAVGEGYERGALFLPQLLQAARAGQAAFEAIRERLPAQEGDSSKRVILATVRGDVHDIGKNIVKVLLQNYGFSVIDLGKDVPPEAVLAAVRESGATLVGLSALMTTTVPAMRETIALLRRDAPGVSVMVGGAVLSEELAISVGADAYGADAMASVRIAKRLLP